MIPHCHTCSICLVTYSLLSALPCNEHHGLSPFDLGPSAFDSRHTPSPVNSQQRSQLHTLHSTCSKMTCPPKRKQQQHPCISPHITCCSCRVFRKAGAIDPALYRQTDSLQLGPATNPRHWLPFKLHCSNVGYQMLMKQGWEEGKGLGHGAKGRAEPYVPTQQYGGHLELGCKRYKAILTGKGAEDEIRVCAHAAHPVNLSNPVMSVCEKACLSSIGYPCMCMQGFFPSV